MTPDRDDDAEARFTHLFHDVYDDVLRFAQRRVPNGAEDVAAETFLVAWRRLEDLPAPIDDARAWLFGVARNTLANARRADQRRDALAVRLASAVDGPAVGAEGAELRIDIARAWAGLDAAQQEAIALTVLDGLTSPQAARVLGISPVAYRLRLSRARAVLRKHLGAAPATRSTSSLRTPRGALTPLSTSAVPEEGSA